MKDKLRLVLDTFRKGVDDKRDRIAIKITRDAALTLGFYALIALILIIALMEGYTVVVIIKAIYIGLKVASLLRDLTDE